MTDAARIAELESENARLRAEVERLWTENGRLEAWNEELREGLGAVQKLAGDVVFNAAANYYGA